MNRLASAWWVLLVALALLLAATAFVFYPGSELQQPVPVRAGEQEIAWLYPATAPTSWNRFVMALARAEKPLARATPGLRVRIDSRTFPEGSVTVPEAALGWPDGRRLVFRWYKITSEQDLGYWIRALLKRQPAPLALLGGSTSDTAYRLLKTLEKEAVTLSPEHRPLMLLTTGTADRWISSPNEPERVSASLFDLYPERTFRFCFSNAQMARATCEFIWSRPDLRPDRDPAYLIHWLDDSYSRDLVEGYVEALQDVAVRSSLEDQAWVLGLASAAGLGAGPLPGGVLPVHRLGTSGSSFRPGASVSPQLIDSSVGTFTLANRFEVEVSRYLLQDLAAHPEQRRPLLAVTGQLQPCRRFLREIVRSDPRRVQQLVAMTGDAVTFTTLYRDRRTHWPIQDLPFSLVAFAHQNPVDREAGFRPEETASRDDDEGGVQTSQAGTDDLLHLEDIVVALGLAWRDPSEEPAPVRLARLLRRLGHVNGQIVTEPNQPRLFDERGNRATGTGEHLLCLRPRAEGERILPEATLEIFRRVGPIAWQPVGEPLLLRYDQPAVNSGDRP